MAYMHIDNLYKDSTILDLFRECYALEKVHGTSAHIKFFPPKAEGFKTGIARFPGGVKPSAFDTTIPTDEELADRFMGLDAGENIVTVYGEAYGGKCQRMRETYGDKLRFIVFDVRIGDCWLAVPDAKDVARALGLDFVPYDRILATAQAVNDIRDAPSTVALLRGMGTNKMREGVVLRPLIELRTNDGRRVIAKHKRIEFAERQNPPRVKQPPSEAMRDAQAIAEEWVTPMRLAHVLDAFPQPHGLEITGEVIKAMVADVEREAGDEIVVSRVARKAIGGRGAVVYKDYLKTLG